MEYLKALQAKGLNMDQAAAVLMDLKRRIKNDRCTIERDSENVVLGGQ